jgi:membrane protease YdiL (CAAX protease family)
MKAIAAFVTSHPVATYFVLTFTISWGGVLLVISGPGGMTGVKAQDNPLFPLAVLAMVAGPSVASLLLTGLLEGRAGLRELRARLFRWRVGAGWYAIALLAAPLASAAVALPLSLASPEFLPGILVADDKTGLLLLGLAAAMTAGFFEELGWTGFAIPRLKRHHGVIATGLIVGVLWSAWHILVVVWGMGDRAGAVPLVLFVVVDGLAGLPAFRVLMVWIYKRTGSLFISMLMHLSITTTVIVLTPQTTGWALLGYGLAFAAAVWLVMACVTLLTGTGATAPPHRSRWKIANDRESVLDPPARAD